MQGTKVTPTSPPLRNDISWRVRFEKLFVKMELFGVKAANKLHRGFINIVLLFIAYNMYSFVSNYNAYWRLRRDPNVPKQWLEEQDDPGQQDWEHERERVKREERMIGRSGLKDKKYYD
jgi:hypothetical protein